MGFVLLTVPPDVNETNIELPSGQLGALNKATRGFAVGVITGAPPLTSGMTLGLTVKLTLLTAASRVYRFLAVTWIS
jgi:hypothetical protein